MVIVTKNCSIVRKFLSLVRCGAKRYRTNVGTLCTMTYSMHNSVISTVRQKSTVLRYFVTMLMVEGVRFRILGLGVSIKDLGLRYKGLGFKVQGSSLRN
jgi:hypothetical protein